MGIDQVVSLMETDYVFCVVGTEVLDIVWMNFRLTSPSGVEVENASSCTHIPTYVFIARCVFKDRATFTFCFMCATSD